MIAVALDQVVVLRLELSRQVGEQLIPRRLIKSRSADVQDLQRLPEGRSAGPRPLESAAARARVSGVGGSVMCECMHACRCEMVVPSVCDDNNL